MRRILSMILSIALILVLAAFNVSASTPGFIDSCQTLDTPGEYTLNQSITGVTETCFTITADNVILNGNEYSVTDLTDVDSRHYGVYAFGRNNITIKNIKIYGASIMGISGFDSGIRFDSVNNSIITNITTYYNYDEGIYLLNSFNNLISDSNSSRNGDPFGNRIGITLSSSSNNQLNSITANSNLLYGIYLQTSSNNQLNSITANSNLNTGIFIETSSNNQLNSITANSNLLYGIYLRTSSNNNQLNSVTANNNRLDGIRLFLRSNNNQLNSVTANSNAYGIWLQESSNNNFTQLTTNSNEKGIYFQTSSNNQLNSVTANSNTNNGIYLEESSNNNQLNSITANSNLNTGIYFQTSSNNNLSFITANSNANGVKFAGSSYNILSDADLSLNSLNGVLVGFSGFANSKNNTLLNASYALSQESVFSQASLIREWYVDAGVKNKKGEKSLLNYIISIYDRFDNLVFTGLTDESGKVARQEVIEYVNNGGIRTSYNNYTLTASRTKGNEKMQTSTLNVDGNKEIVFVV